MRQREGWIEGKGHWTVRQREEWGVGSETKRRLDRRKREWTLVSETQRSMGSGQ
jgi:hypothetical protein